MVLKITRDELPMEQGVYGGCLLCPLYPLLAEVESDPGKLISDDSSSENKSRNQI